LIGLDSVKSKGRQRAKLPTFERADVSDKVANVHLRHAK
jgi:hypothetical protein